MHDIIEGYNNKIKREAKVIRKAAFITILPHVKNLSEERFNIEIWPIDEVKEDNESFEKKHLEKAQETLKRHNIKLSEARRLKSKK